MRTITITAKCSDLCLTTFFDGKEEYETSGYAPNISGLCKGDYVNLTVDLDTGKIVGWQIPSNEEILSAMNIKEDKKNENF